MSGHSVFSTSRSVASTISGSNNNNEIASDHVATARTPIMGLIKRSSADSAATSSSSSTHANRVQGLKPPQPRPTPTHQHRPSYSSSSSSSFSSKPAPTPIDDEESGLSSGAEDDDDETTSKRRKNRIVRNPHSWACTLGKSLAMQSSMKNRMTAPTNKDELNDRVMANAAAQLTQEYAQHRPCLFGVADPAKVTWCNTDVCEPTQAYYTFNHGNFLADIVAKTLQSINCQTENVVDQGRLVSSITSCIITNFKMLVFLCSRIKQSPGTQASLTQLYAFVEEGSVRINDDEFLISCLEAAQEKALGNDVIKHIHPDSFPAIVKEFRGTPDACIASSCFSAENVSFHAATKGKVTLTQMPVPFLIANTTKGIRRFTLSDKRLWYGCRHIAQGKSTKATTENAADADGEKKRATPTNTLFAFDCEPFLCDKQLFGLFEEYTSYLRVLNTSIPTARHLNSLKHPDREDLFSGLTLPMTCVDGIMAFLLFLTNTFFFSKKVEADEPIRPLALFTAYLQNLEAILPKDKSALFRFLWQGFVVNDATERVMWKMAFDQSDSNQPRLPQQNISLPLTKHMKDAHPEATSSAFSPSSATKKKAKKKSDSKDEDDTEPAEEEEEEDEEKEEVDTKQQQRKPSSAAKPMTPSPSVVKSKPSSPATQTTPAEVVDDTNKDEEAPAPIKTKPSPNGSTSTTTTIHLKHADVAAKARDQQKEMKAAKAASSTAVAFAALAAKAREQQKEMEAAVAAAVSSTTSSSNNNVIEEDETEEPIAAKPSAEKQTPEQDDDEAESAPPDTSRGRSKPSRSSKTTRTSKRKQDETVVAEEDKEAEQPAKATSSSSSSPATKPRRGGAATKRAKGN